MKKLLQEETFASFIDISIHLFTYPEFPPPYIQKALFLKCFFFHLSCTFIMFLLSFDFADWCIRHGSEQPNQGPDVYPSGFSQRCRTSETTICSISLYLHPHSCGEHYDHHPHQDK